MVSVQAEKYEPPKLNSLEWQNGQTTYKNNENWKSDYQLQEGQVEGENSKARTPSSGEENKPKFWDFKVVK